MAWSGLTLTKDGQIALNQAQMSKKMNFKSIVIGDGDPPKIFSQQKELVNELFEITELKISVTENKCILTADIPKVGYDYYFREIGIIVCTDNGDKLYVYDNCREDAQHIIAAESETSEKRISLSLVISDVSDITVSTPSVLYVSYTDYEKTLEKLDSKVSIVVTEKGIPVSERTPNTFYFTVTDRQAVTTVDYVKVSPNMGLKIL